MSSSKGSSWPRDRTCISHGSCIAGRLFTAEPPGNIYPPLSICCSSSSVMSDSLSSHGLQQATLPCLFTNSQSLCKLMSIELMMQSNHLILCRPILLLPAIFPSLKVFSSESGLCIKWPKNWSFSISPSKEYSGLISFRIDWFDLLAVQGTLKSLP